jgi:hypothetical protein
VKTVVRGWANAADAAAHNATQADLMISATLNDEQRMVNSLGRNAERPEAGSFDEMASSVNGRSSGIFSVHARLGEC